MNRHLCSILTVAFVAVATPAAAQFVPPPPELENRIPAPLPPPPLPPVINGPAQQRPPQGVVQPSRLDTSSDRASRCLHQGGSSGLTGADLDAYTRSCVNAK